MSVHAKEQKARPDTMTGLGLKKKIVTRTVKNQKQATLTSPPRALLPVGLQAGEDSDREEVDLGDTTKGRQRAITSRTLSRAN